MCSCVCTQGGVLCVSVVSARSDCWVAKSVDVRVSVCLYSVLNFSGGSTCTHKQSVRLFMWFVDSNERAHWVTHNAYENVLKKVRRTSGYCLSEELVEHCSSPCTLSAVALLMNSSLHMRGSCSFLSLPFCVFGYVRPPFFCFCSSLRLVVPTPSSDCLLLSGKGMKV